MSTVSYKPKTSDIPTAPGVYVFRDEHNRVLYVGKAKNLRNRLSSYFGKLESLADRTRRMVSTASQVTWTVVNSEREALQLEFTWIKEYSPPFNVQFRDDKSYPYLAFTGSETFSRVYITRNKRNKKDRYFGPYTKAWALRETLDHLLPVFPVRSCSDSTFQRAHRSQRPCLLGDIGRCGAPCVGRITEKDHADLVNDFANFMAGKNDSYVRTLRQRMSTASQNQEYELAGKLRDNIAALEAVLEKSAVVLSTKSDIDVFGIARDELSAAVHMFMIRASRIRGVHSWTVDTELDISDADLVTNALRVAYDGSSAPAPMVCVPILPGDSESVEEWLSDLRRQDTGSSRSAQVVLRKPQRGELVAVANTVTHNAEHNLALYKLRRGADFTARTKALTDLQNALNLDEPLLRIECYDISHLSGSDVVGSMVVFEDGLAKKSDYKKFKVIDTSDDTESLAQVLTRRAKYLTEREDETSSSSFSYPPALFVVDGGQPQVNAAAVALRRAGVGFIPVIGIAKRLEEIWLPQQSYPVILPRNSEALFLLQQIRDEAHRVAISYNRSLRTKRTNTELENIPGLGPAKIAALLKKFKSVTQIKKQSLDTLCSVPGVSPAVAEKLLLHLNAKQPAE